MAVRTSPVDGRSLPGWARARVGSDPGTVHLNVVAPGSVTPEAARRCATGLVAAGYRRIVTNAMAPDDARAFTTAGFVPVEELFLFTRSLADLPSASVPTRRTSRRSVVALDRLAFGARAFDRAALIDACGSTPVSRVRVSGPRRAPTGYALTGIAGWRAYVQRLAVHPDARRRGIGRGLLADGLRWAARCGARTALVNTHDDNPGAKALYEAFGFEQLPEGLVVVELRS
ncbi:MAG: hypothetical protein AMXMBFR46_19580 [Acidimicrobiia bacterium]